MGLKGRTILVVEDEPLIALDIVEGFEAAGAVVYSARNLRDGMRLAAHPDLSAAVIDFGLNDGEAGSLCERLSERHIPFVLHTGHTHVPVPCRSAVLVPKPAARGQLVSAIEALLASPIASLPATT